MIEVNIEYSTRTDKKTGYERYFYKKVEVKGHANNQSDYTNIRICAGITAIVQSSKVLFDEYFWKTTVGVGYFLLSNNEWSRFTRATLSRNDYDYHMVANTIVCQLWSIYQQFPSAFGSFNMINVGGKTDD